MFAIQSEIAQRIARALKVRVLATEKKGLERKATNKPDAYTLYLRGHHFLFSGSEEGLKKAVDCFEQALTKDPGYAKAYAGLADSHAVMALLEFLPPRDAFPKAMEAAQKALEIDSGLAEAHTSLGAVLFQYDWDWPGAEREFRRAIKLNPNYPSAHQFYADYLKAMGRFQEALEEMNRAHDLDPLSSAINTGIGHVLYLTREYDRAIEQYGNTLKLDSTFVPARLWLGSPYLQKKMYKEALA